MAASPHITTLAGTTPHITNAAGAIQTVDANSFQILERLSLRRLLLQRGGVREPHWHADANELGYCISGDHLVTIADSHNASAVFTIAAGEMFFVPSGAMHSIQNLGAGPGEIILAFSAERVEDFGISGTLGAFTAAVLSNSTGVPEGAFAGFKRSTHDRLLGTRPMPPRVDAEARRESAYKFPLEQTAPEIYGTGGSARTAQVHLWPMLKAISMFSVVISPTGMREVHWHPETAEMGYVARGQGRMTVLSPGGDPDTYTMAAGDMYFIPRAYPHHIENLGSDDLHLLIFFDQNVPGDIGAKSVVSTFTRETLAASLGVAENAVPPFPVTENDPLIVPRLNPIDR